MNILIAVVLSVVLLFVGGCGALSYRATEAGQMEGTVYLAWIGPDEFIYIHSDRDPLKFKRAGTDKWIEPKTMFTDGGSIPRFIWWHKEYSPWRFAPAFMVHDWLFVAHHCGHDDADQHTHKTAADVMMEAIKTQMEKDAKVKDLTTFGVVRWGVRSAVAKHLWETGPCREPTGAALAAANRLRAALEPAAQLEAMSERVESSTTQPAAAAVTISVDDWKALAPQAAGAGGPQPERIFSAQPEAEGPQNVLIPVMVMKVK